jgi:hypothetical protein
MAEFVIKPKAIMSLTYQLEGIMEPIFADISLVTYGRKVRKAYLYFENRLISKLKNVCDGILYFFEKDAPMIMALSTDLQIRLEMDPKDESTVFPEFKIIKKQSINKEKYVESEPLISKMNGGVNIQYYENNHSGFVWLGEWISVADMIKRNPNMKKMLNQV